MPRKWILAIALGTSLLLLARFGLPALVENQLNRVTPHAPWVVSREAQSLHQTLLIADLHADPLLWERDWLHRSRRGHTDLPRLQEGGVALQVFTAVTQSPSGQNYESNEIEGDTITYLAVAQGWPIDTWSQPI
ncbi:MAG: peptidase M19, partial [Myxococcota bacterium]|nr:peptidase M19 [Myxococcota bacterium]